MISVIVPIYNVEEYINRCISSIVNQTYRDLEIILVDDGSPDNCPKICDDWANKDNRIKVIHKKNGGLSDARNVALDIAVGSYVTFVDGDDFIDINYINVLYRNLITNNADISTVNFERVFQYVELANDKKIYKSTTYTTREALLDMLLMKNLTQTAWGKLYKIELFSKLRYPKGALYEDLAIAYKLLVLTKKVVYCEESLYKYFIRKDSIMQREFSINQYVEIQFIEESMSIVENKYPELHVEIRIRKVVSYFQTLYRILSSKDRGEYIAEQETVMKMIKIYSKGLIFNKSVNKNLKIKIISFQFGKWAFFGVKKVSDIIRFIKAGRRYIV